jgi:hypothetical protein
LNREKASVVTGPSGPVPQIEAPVVGGASIGVAAYNAVSCSSSANCIAVGATSSGVAQVGMSSDGGLHYVATTLPSGVPPLHAVSCASSTQCAAVGVNHWLSSGDGGKSWRDHVVSDLGLNLLGVYCSSTSCLSAGTETKALRPNEEAQIFRSSAGGSTWKPASVPPQVAGIGSIACPTSTTCIAVGTAVLVSTDDGQTWNEVGVTGGFQQLTSIACSSSTKCTAIGPNPGGVHNHALGADAVETTDGGNTFHAVDFPYYSASLFDVACASATSCIARGAEGTGQSGPAFVSSSDGVVTWQSGAPPPSFVAVAGISCPTGGSCVLVGQTASGAAATSLSPGGQWSAAQLFAP